MADRTVQQLFDLTGQTALLTGGTGYLGAAIGQALAEAGASVVVSSTVAARGQAAAAALPSPGGVKHHGVELDQTDPASIRKGFQAAVNAAGKVDVLVNNGLHAIGKDLTDISFEEFLKHQANTAGYFELARLLRNYLVERSAPGSVINLGSMYGQVASYPDAYEGLCAASPVAYHAHKGGTIQITRHLAIYWAKDRVRVNCISPGPFPNAGKVSEEIISRLCDRSPMNRMGEPWELKGAVVFLASAASSYVTGQNLTVDGGWTAW